ncbi:sirohydrochlorin chelatase [Bacillus sp. RAR_GA_16]|uniref:sirohydrochlorin chelatase n=1 Tax=Bacillus sp. RAR_GA_16 TaxID=2876774 RepID=UPI001CCE7EA5|nr:sirohydrochlorin chelatase [Bacillus sp. RAR_GA_16]MCA0171041.1 sirohydrochlorin chelatase [Bacillus sp. RAR_GA_16]
MKAVLYICHGSRVKEGRNQAVEFVRKCKEELSYPIQETCFLELSEPNIYEGITTCIQQGAKEIVVVPVLLLAATHVKKDIPNEVERISGEFPWITFHIGRPLGIHDKLISVIEERVSETGILVRKDASAILVGRGSSDSDTRIDINEIANRIFEKMTFQSVSVCYLAAANPTFDEGIKQAKKGSNSQVFVIPYLLFTGILMKEMEHKISRLEKDGPDFYLCHYLGYHDLLKDVLKERVIEAFETGVTI